MLGDRGAAARGYLDAMLYTAIGKVCCVAMSKAENLSLLLHPAQMSKRLLDAAGRLNFFQPIHNHLLKVFELVGGRRHDPIVAQQFTEGLRI